MVALRKIETVQPADDRGASILSEGIRKCLAQAEGNLDRAAILMCDRASREHAFLVALTRHRLKEICLDLLRAEQRNVRTNVRAQHVVNSARARQLGVTHVEHARKVAIETSKSIWLDFPLPCGKTIRNATGHEVGEVGRRRYLAPGRTMIRQGNMFLAIEKQVMERRVGDILTEEQLAGLWENASNA